jgi:transcriptional regulator with XRE-family HTH domain
VAEVPGRGTESVGERLKRLRVERGLSQRQLSAPGISYAYISRIEAGARRPSVKALRMLAAKLGVTAQYLETGSQLDDAEARELRLADLELRLRLDGQTATDDLQALARDADEHADEGAAVRARIALGLEAAARGGHGEAAEHLQRAVDSELVTAVGRPDVYLALGHAYASSGTPWRAVELLEQCLVELGDVAPDDLATRVRFSTYLSYALTDLGELQRAQAVVAGILRDSDEATTDPYTRVRLHWSLGRVSIEHARPEAALDSFRRAIGLLEATDDTMHLARAHMACAEAGMISDAGRNGVGRHLDEAERLLALHPDPNDLAVVRRLRALHAAGAGDYEEAERLGQEALELTEELPNEHGQAWWAIAEARAGAGDPDADDAFRQAIDVLRDHGSVRNYANVLRAYGRYLREAGREGDALDVFERAADVASNLQGEPTTAER